MYITIAIFCMQSKLICLNSVLKFSDSQSIFAKVRAQNVEQTKELSTVGFKKKKYETNIRTIAFKQ